MKAAKRHIIAGVGFSILLVTILLLPQKGTAAPPQVQEPVDVKVVNTATQPVPVSVAQPVQVRNTDHPARQAYQTLLSANIPSGEAGGSSSFTVPPGKQLVIEYVSILGVLEEGEKFLMAVINTQVGTGPSVDHVFPLQDRGQVIEGVNPTHFWVGNEQTRIYADPGTTVSVSGQRNNVNPTTGSVSFRISGHLVNIP
jgi:hypothetical protein